MPLNPTQPGILCKAVLGTNQERGIQWTTARLESGEIVKVCNLGDGGLKAGTYVNLAHMKRGNGNEFGDWAIIDAEE